MLVAAVVLMLVLVHQARVLPVVLVVVVVEMQA
jgi:hypothetical protein